ncbi:hypothetical protein BXU06_09085 [Aquaspirillum sp. LM1]|uniref:caspase family protein n=1 Tax=Aquaspirillum sp. LM1 TaxID=1938604 RepID=UPI000983E253|nr:caspase family protein [Aquaspirillum sp. LM1]AQR65196.1 hypothetical protein BXU06_09085 [Aquaspirillum sp. LM1]
MPPIPPPRPRVGQTHWARLYTLLCILLLTITAHASEPTATPLLRLEVGMLTAKINRIASDGQGRWAVTASHDKTARLWEVASGKLLGVLRPPQGEGNEGKLYAVAMSQDGRQIAVAGWTGEDTIYLYQHNPQQHSLRLARRLSGLPNVVNHLAFSADGRWLAAGLGGNHGVRVFDAASGQLTGQNTSYGDRCHSVAFRPVKGNQPLELLTSSYDGLLRLHPVDAQGRLGAPRVQRAPGGGQQPFAARFSPDGQRIAVGFADSTVVQVLDAHDLRELFRPERQGVDSGGLSSVAWSADGRSLVAAGRGDVQGQYTMRRWAAQDGHRLTDTPLAADTVMDLAPLPQGGWLFAAQNPTLGVLDAQGTVQGRQDAQQADLRGQHDQLRLSADGQQLRFGFAKWGKQPYVFDISRRQLLLRPAAANEPSLYAARTHAGALKVENWEDNTQPRLNGQPIQLKPYELARSLAIDANGQGFVLGTSWSLRGYQRDGKRQWQKPVPGVAWAVNQSQDGRWVVAGYGDGTIRWHRREDGQEVLALFAHRDGKRWVLWTPEGFYAASEGGEELFGYHLNRGKDQDGEFVSAGQLSELFHRPALISQRLSPEGDALMAEAVKQLGTVDEVLAHARSLPPILTVEAPSGQRVEGDSEIEVTVRLQNRGGGIGPVKLFVDGQEVSGRQAAATEGITSQRTYALRLSPGEHQVAFQATSLRGVAGPLSAPLHARVRQVGVKTLHILAIGVQNYPADSGQSKLNYSVLDAKAVAKVLARRAKPVFSHVAEPVVLTEQNASLAGINQAFAQLKTRMQPQDTLVIFLAGHGQVHVDSYRFLPWDYRPGSAGLSETRLFEMLKESPQHTLLLIDTCDAGSMVEMAGAYERMSRERQRPVIGASRKGEFAREGYQKHGVFTAALLNVLARPQREQLTVMELYPQTKRRVEEFSKKLPGNYLQTVQGYVANGEFPLVWR